MVCMRNMTRRAMLATVSLSLVGAFSLFGCSSGASADSGTAGSGAAGDSVELQVFAANSLSKAMDEAQALYTQQNPQVTFADTQYKGSGELNEMLAAGTYADIEITASRGTMDAAADKGYIDEATRTDMFTNDLVIVAKEGSGLQNVSLQDIADGTYTVAVGDESVPAGNYAAQALSTVGAYVTPDGATGKDATGKGGSYVGITPVMQTSVGNVCKQAQNGDVDVAIVYSSDVYRFGGVEIVGVIADDAHKAIAYPGAICSDSQNAEAAQAFLDWCLNDPDAQKIWAKWGFELA